jgi:hypothetical protein
MKVMNWAGVIPGSRLSKKKETLTGNLADLSEPISAHSPGRGGRRVFSKTFALLGGLFALAAGALGFMAIHRSKIRNPSAGGDGHLPSPDDPVRARLRDVIQGDQAGAYRVYGLTKTEAEEVLDWLENHGIRGCQVSYVSGQGFMVWRERPRAGT